MEVSEQVRLRELLTSHIVSLCNSSLEYCEDVTIEGLLGITVDKKDIILVNIKEVITSLEQQPISEADSQQECPLPSETLMPRLRAALQGSNASIKSRGSRKGKRKAQPFKIPYTERPETKKVMYDEDSRDSDKDSTDLENLPLVKTDQDSPDASQDSLDIVDTPPAPQDTEDMGVLGTPVFPDFPTAIPADDSDPTFQWISQHVDMESIDSTVNESSNHSTQNGDSLQDGSSNRVLTQYTQETNSVEVGEGLDSATVSGYQLEKSHRGSASRGTHSLRSSSADIVLPQTPSTSVSSPNDQGSWGSRKRVVRKHDPELMVELVTMIRAGKITLADAARKYNIPRPTLSDKVRGRTPITTDKQNRRVLTPEEEEELVVWCLEKASSGANPTMAEFMKQVNQYLQNHGRSSLANSKEWLKSFLRRHNELPSSGITFDT